MVTTDDLLMKMRSRAKRLRELLEGDERNVLVWAELVHEAAHMMEHFGALDEALSAGALYPDAWMTKEPLPPIVEPPQA